MMPIGQTESDAALQSPAAQAHSPARTPQTQLAHAVAPQAARSAPTSGFALTDMEVTERPSSGVTRPATAQQYDSSPIVGKVVI